VVTAWDGELSFRVLGRKRHALRRYNRSCQVAKFNGEILPRYGAMGGTWASTTDANHSCISRLRRSASSTCRQTRCCSACLFEREGPGRRPPEDVVLELTG
jgi:hypothetical protein